MPTLLGKKDIGYFYGGCRGSYTGKAIQEDALALGWAGEAILDPEDEFYYEATEEAIDWLNANCAGVGVYFGWNDGDFGLYLIDEET